MTDKPKTAKKLTKEEVLHDLVDRSISAHYMLAKAIDQNTMMYDALIVAINSAKPDVMTGEYMEMGVEIKTPEQCSEEETKVYTVEECKCLLIKVVTTLGKEKGMDLLAQYNTKNLGGLKGEDYVAFCQKAEGLLA